MILALECLAAELAGEAALVAMSQFVLGECRSARKHFAAHLRVNIIKHYYNTIYLCAFEECDECCQNRISRRQNVCQFQLFGNTV